MAITWGSAEGHLQVGIDCWTSTPTASSTSVTVYLRVYVRIPTGTDWRFDDNQNYSISGTGGGSGSFHNNLNGAGAQKQIYSKSFSAAINYTNSGSITWTASISGMYNGGTPSHTRTLNLPERPPSVPNAPTGLTVTSVQSTQVSLSWSTPANNGLPLDKSSVWLSRNSSFTDVIYNAEVAPWSTSRTITGLPKGTTLWARVYAHNDVGYGPPSSPVSFTTGTTAPGAPGAAVVSNIGPTQAFAQWAAPSDMGGAPLIRYELDRATNSSFSQDLVTTGVTSTSLNMTGLAKNRTYYLRVRAVTSAGNGSYSSTTSFTTSSTVPGPPATPTVGTVTPTTAAISWSAPSDTGGLSITGYDVQRSTSPNFVGDAVTVSDNASPNTLSGLVPGKTYYVRVRAKNGTGPGDWSPSATFTTLSGVKVGNGTQWRDAVVRVGNGSEWVVCQVRRGTGTGWS
jgi:hypothetical protein